MECGCKVPYHIRFRCTQCGQPLCETDLCLDYHEGKCSSEPAGQAAQPPVMPEGAPTAGQVPLREDDESGCSDDVSALDGKNTQQASQKHQNHSVSGYVSETLDTHSICKSSLKFQKHKKHSVSGYVSETLETFLPSRVSATM